MLVVTLSTLTEINQFHHHSSLMEDPETDNIFAFTDEDIKAQRLNS